MSSRVTRLPETEPLMWVDYLTAGVLVLGAAWWSGERAPAVTTLMVFLFARAIAGRGPALLGALAALLGSRQGGLPLEVALSSLALVSLWLSAEHESTLLAVVAGAVVAVGSRFHLFSALVTLGVAVVWWLLASARLWSGPSLMWLVAVLLSCAAIALPLQLLEPHALTLPALEPAAWLQPLPLVCLTSLAWLMVSAFRSKDGREALLALWLLASPWNLVPVAFAAVALVLRDVFTLARVRPRR